MIFCLIRQILANKIGRVLFGKTESYGVLAFQPIIIEVTEVNVFLRNLKPEVTHFHLKNSQRVK